MGRFPMTVLAAAALAGAGVSAPAFGAHEPGGLVWQTEKLGWFPRMPRLVGGILCLSLEGDLKPDYAAQVVGIDAATGRIAWRFATDGPAACRPVAAGGTILVSCRGGTAYGIDARTGRARWKLKVGGVYENPCVAGSLALLGMRQEIIAVEIATGKVRWRAPGGGEGNSELGMVAAGGMVCCTDLGPPRKGPVRALGLAAGKQAWSHPKDGAAGRIFDIEVAGGTVLVAGGALVALDGATGRETWSFAPAPAAEGVGCLSVAGGVVYCAAVTPGGYDPEKKHNVPARTHELCAIDLGTGKPKWRVAVDRKEAMRKSVAAGGAVYFGSTERCLRLNGATGAVEWEARDCYDLFLVQDGIVYVDTEDGVRALDAATGAPEWTAPVKKNTYTGELIATGGLIIFVDGATAGKVFAVKAGRARERQVF